MERPLCGTTHTSSGTAGIGCTRTGIIGHVLEIPLIFHLVGKEFLLRTLMPLFMYGPGPRTSTTFSKVQRSRERIATCAFIIIILYYYL